MLNKKQTLHIFQPTLLEVLPSDFENAGSTFYVKALGRYALQNGPICHAFAWISNTKSQKCAHMKKGAEKNHPPKVIWMESTHFNAH